MMSSKLIIYFFYYSLQAIVIGSTDYYLSRTDFVSVRLIILKCRQGMMNTELA